MLHRFFVVALFHVLAPSMVAQTVPTSITVKRTGPNGNHVELCFPSISGQNYRVLTSASLLPDTWVDTNITAGGNGGELTMVVPDAGGPPRHYFRLAVTAALSPGFVSIPAGSFLMGDQSIPADGTPAELPVISVSTHGFQMQSTEVTKSQWDATYVWAASNGYTFANPGLGVAGNHPVHTINWYDAVKWCNARSEQESLPPCYFVNNAIYRTGTPSSVRWEPTALGYRLPTEAEWEKAARGQLTGQRFPFGGIINHSLANYVANNTLTYDTNPANGPHPSYERASFPYSSPVASFTANGYGLHDMAGNMLEWCWDRPTSDYSAGYTVDLTSASASFQRSLRGGSWLGQAGVARVSRRGSAFPDTGRGTDVGFRMVRGRLH
jgi:formylglycine-generating enzyme required for sulfatase activity